VAVVTQQSLSDYVITAERIWTMGDVAVLKQPLGKKKWEYDKGGGILQQGFESMITFVC
jgi:hypothetical protein